MKNKKLIISVICVALSVIACAVMIHFSNKNFVEDVFLGSDIEDSVDEYLINQGRVKFPEKQKVIRLIEGYDTDFEKDSKKLEKTVAALKKTDFEAVFIKSRYFSQEDDTLSYEQNLEKTENVISLIKEQGKKVYLEIALETEEYAYESVAALCDGIILKENGNSSPEKLNYVIGKRVKLIKNIKSDAEIFALLSFDYDISKFNKKSVDGVFAVADGKTDGGVIDLWSKSLKIADCRFILGIDLNSVAKKKSEADFPLKAMYSVQQSESLAAVCFSSLKSVTENPSGSYSAINVYMNKGIVPDIAFRELNITGYEGGTVETTDFSRDIELCGSSLFPVTFNGQQIDLGEKGSQKMTLELSEGENVFLFTQCGKSVEYRVNMSFDGELIRSVMPSDTLTVQPKEKINVTVIAYTGADITVKVGTMEYEAKRDENAAAGYAAYTVRITMPKTRDEVSSLGMISVIGKTGQRSEQKKGALIVCGDRITTTKAPVTQKDETTSAIQLGNYVQELIEDKYEYVTAPFTTTAPAFTPPAAAQPTYEAFSGSQMCVVTVPYADTRPLVYNDDTYVPSYSTLVQGTTDYITAKSSAYNSEENETVYFYELASGRKVKCEHVQLISTAVSGNNTMELISDESSGGTLTIKLKTDWKVPYAVTNAPQSFYSAYGGKYNVSSFNSDYLRVEFYHTSSVKGKINASGSNVISSADWGIYPSENKAVLTMKLKDPGKYYGTSVSYDAQGYMIITVHNKPESLSGAVILLDPGHGGDDPGALGIGKQVKESDVNLAVAYATRDALRARGATVYLTRQGNETLSLDERKNIAYSLKPDMYVSIHSNGSENSSQIGTSVYYYKSFSQPLALNIYNEMINVFRNNLYYGQQELYGELSDGARYYPFSVTRLEDCPSVLIETGFMTNDNECYKLIQSQTHTLFGNAIADGIEKTISG